MYLEDPHSQIIKVTIKETSLVKNLTFVYKHELGAWQKKDDDVQGMKKIGSDEDKDGDPETKWITCSNN